MMQVKVFVIKSKELSPRDRMMQLQRRKRRKRPIPGMATATPWPNAEPPLSLLTAYQHERSQRPTVGLSWKTRGR
jgi:hypothetical protein